MVRRSNKETAAVDLPRFFSFSSGKNEKKEEKKRGCCNIAGNGETKKKYARRINIYYATSSNCLSLVICFFLQEEEEVEKRFSFLATIEIDPVFVHLHLLLNLRVVLDWDWEGLFSLMIHFQVFGGVYIIDSSDRFYSILFYFFATRRKWSRNGQQ